MSVKVKLVESPTIWLLKIDSDCFITETDEISEENQVELRDLIPNKNGNSKCTQTLAALQISEKEQTFPLIMKVAIFLVTFFYCNCIVIFLYLGTRFTSNYMGFIR